MKNINWLTRLPKGCIFSHVTSIGERVFKRFDSHGLLHCYIKYDNGMVYHWLSHNI